MTALRLVVLLMLFADGANAAGDAPESLGGDLVVFHAGSLSAPFDAIAKAFMQRHPEVRVLREAAGSRACARKITDLGRPCDVFASADYAVIDTLLIPKHADWNIRFARNEMEIVYTERSRRFAEITPENWMDILLDAEVAFGRADPDSDPCGYRAVLTMKLAEEYYRRPGLTERFLAKDRRHIRPKETDLLALLETRTIDYIFLYRSVAIQHGHEYVSLPAEVNLGKPELEDLYRTVCVEISGEAPGRKMTQCGEPMAYGITIPASAPNPGAALAFVKFLLEKEGGLAVMEAQGQPSMVPAPCAGYDQLPEALKPYATRP